MRSRISIYSIVVLLWIPARLLAQVTGDDTGTISDSAGPGGPRVTVPIKKPGIGSEPAATTETDDRFGGSFTKQPHADFVLRQASNCTGMFDGHTGCPLSVEISASEDDDQGLRTASLDVLTRQPATIAHTRFTGLFTTQGSLTLGSRGLDILTTSRDASAVSGESTDPDALSEQQPGATPPKVRHTGFKALVYDTAADFKAFPRRRSTWVILGIGGALALAVHPADDHVTQELSDSETAKDVFVAGKYLGGVPVQAGLAAGLFIVGRYVMHPDPSGSRTNKVSHLGFDLMRGLIVSQALTQAIKVTVRRDRPTGECCAFPSGHASAAFATAAILERHFGYRGAWPTWIIAAYVAASRLADNRHFLSDVMFGSALGVASGWTVVGRHGRSDYTLVPVPIRGGVMISLVRRERTEAQSAR